MTGDERTFFQLVAALLPILLFGTAVTALRPGWVLERARSAEATTSVIVTVTVLVTLALAAELVAIDLLLSTSPITWWKLTLVVYVLMIGTFLLGLSVLIPWYEAAELTGLLLVVGAIGFAVAMLVGSFFVTRSVLDATEQGLREEQECRALALESLTREVAADLDAEAEALTMLGRLENQLEAVMANKQLRARQRRDRASALREEIGLIQRRRETAIDLLELRLDRASEIARGGVVPGC